MRSRGRLGFRPKLMFTAAGESLEDRRLLSGIGNDLPRDAQPAGITAVQDVASAFIAPGPATTTESVSPDSLTPSGSVGSDSTGPVSSGGESPALTAQSGSVTPVPGSPGSTAGGGVSADAGEAGATASAAATFEGDGPSPPVASVVSGGVNRGRHGEPATQERRLGHERADLGG